MRIKISAHQKGEIHHFFKPKFAAFYHWKIPHIWTLFRPTAPPAPKRGENILKGIRGPDTPTVSPSAWPAQPAGLNGRWAENPPLSRSVLPAVPATQSVKPAACQDPLCPYDVFRPVPAPEAPRGEKASIYAVVANAENC